MTDTTAIEVGSSRLPGFYRLDREQRLAALAKARSLAPGDLQALGGGVDFALLDRLVENAVGGFTIPLGVATNMIVDGQEQLVPMATEESSVVAAVGHAAKDCRTTGGFVTTTTGPLMIAQVQLLDLGDPWRVKAVVLEHRDEIRALCDACDPTLVGLGGGFRELEVRILDTGSKPMVVVHLIVDTRDAMGANAVNTMAETLAPTLARWTGARSHLRILSNLADRRLARARATWPGAVIGEAAVRGVVEAAELARIDPYRAATHNKGIMNGVSALALATGNDTRAIEAGAHAYAARDGQYRALSRFEITSAGDLAGVLELPCALGLVGGATKIHPTAQACLRLLGVESADGLARIAVALGLAQNFAALRALATTGIQAGHMKLHAKNMAIAVGAVGDEVEILAARLNQGGPVRHDRAEALLAELRGEGRQSSPRPRSP